MKRLLILVWVLASTLVAQADDGWVIFGDTTIDRISTNSYPGGPATGLMAGPIGSYYFALFVAPTTVMTVSGPNDPNWVFTGNYGTNRVTPPGLFSCGSPGAPVAGAVIVPGYAAGTNANFLVRGWSADWGTDWATVQQELNSGNYGSFYGQSLIAQDIYLDAFDQPLNSIFGSSAPAQIPGFTLNEMNVPEPSTLALGLGTLGIASVELRRQRRGR